MIHNHKNNKNKRYIFYVRSPSHPSELKTKKCLIFPLMEKSNEENVIEEVMALELLCPFFLFKIFPHFFVSYKLDDGSFFI